MCGCLSIYLAIQLVISNCVMGTHGPTTQNESYDQDSYLCLTIWSPNSHSPLFFTLEVIISLSYVFLFLGLYASVCIFLSCFNFVIMVCYM